MNWGFNVFPLLRPSLNRLYPKIAGKDQPLAKIWVNNAVQEDLTWAVAHIRLSLGIKLLSSVTWELEDADATVYCDVSMKGLAFWYTGCSGGFVAPIPDETACDIIFYFEVLAVVSAFNNLCLTMEHFPRIIIYMDSMNTINIFNSLRCQPEFNPLLCHCVDIMIKKNFHVTFQVNRTQSQCNLL